MDRPDDLPAMLATLASYDRLFGPIHIQTLSLAVLVAEGFAQVGDRNSARRLLERVPQPVGPTRRDSARSPH